MTTISFDNPVVTYIDTFTVMPELAEKFHVFSVDVRGQGKSSRTPGHYSYSRATIDGRLSEGFDPEDALKKVTCPMLLLHASWSRHKTWGLVGAMDDTGVRKIQSLVKDLRYAHIESGHEIHWLKPKWYLEQVQSFVDGLSSTRNTQHSNIAEYGRI